MFSTQEEESDAIQTRGIRQKAAPDVYGLEVHLDADDTWLCQHIDSCGHPEPSTRLLLNQAHEWGAGQPTSAPRRWICCADCGTFWRVWLSSRIAKPSADWRPDKRAGLPTRYRRAPERDIDAVIDLVKGELPAIIVTQHEDTHRADDDGIWFFHVPGPHGNIQIESSMGTCPFLVEDDGEGRRDAATVHEAARMVVDYLRAEMASGNNPAAG